MPIYSGFRKSSSWHTALRLRKKSEKKDKDSKREGKLENGYRKSREGLANKVSVKVCLPEDVGAGKSGLRSNSYQILTLLGKHEGVAHCLTSLLRPPPEAANPEATAALLWSRGEASPPQCSAAAASITGAGYSTSTPVHLFPAQVRTLLSVCLLTHSGMSLLPGLTYIDYIFH